MSDGASSSRRPSVAVAGETVVIDHEGRRTSCGYCKSKTNSSISHGMWANSMTADDYQDLLDRGWRRSGCFLYKPEMERTCCPSYTIRLKANDFCPSKEQVRVQKKMQKFLDGWTSANTSDQSKKRSKSPERSINLTSNESSAKRLELSGQGLIDEISGKSSNYDDFHHLASLVDDAVVTLFKNEGLPIVQIPKAVIKRVTLQSKKKLVGVSNDLLFTCSISFQIAAVMRKSMKDGQEDMASSHFSPVAIAEKLALLLEKHEQPSNLFVKACNGHINFYSNAKDMFSEVTINDGNKQASKGVANSMKNGPRAVQNSRPPHKRRKLEIKLKRSSFDPEEFALYKKYQIKVHNDKPEKVTESSYRRFLVDTPIIYVPARGDNKTIPPCGFGSFHQQYLIDGKLIAVGVVDILPRCLSSKYLFWDPDFAFLSLGKYSALQEINWVKETQSSCSSLQYYYLGYYIHSCKKMRYKAAYRPSELLCPLRYKWVPFEIARPLLDRKPYYVLSDFLVAQGATMLPEHPNADGISVSISNNSPQDEDSDDEDEDEDEDEEFELDSEGPDADLLSESEIEATVASEADNSGAYDVSEILLDLNGPRIKFKDLGKVFGHINRQFLSKLELQLKRYMKVVGPELASRIVYSLG